MAKFLNSLREELTKMDIRPCISVYDLFSASIAAKYYKGIFISVYDFVASRYGLPDIRFIYWFGIVALRQKVKTLLSHHHIIVDIDDGYVDITAEKLRLLSFYQ